MRDTVARKFFPRVNEELMIHYEETEVRSKTAILSFPSLFLFLRRRSRFDKYWSVDRSRGYCQATSTWLFSHNSKTFPQRTSVLDSISFFFVVNSIALPSLQQLSRTCPFLLNAARSPYYGKFWKDRFPAWTEKNERSRGVQTKQKQMTEIMKCLTHVCNRVNHWLNPLYNNHRKIKNK